MSAELKAIRQQAQDFIATNLAECCAEELEWQNTGILCNGKLREAAKLYGQLDKSHALPMAQSETARQAMRRAALASQSVAELEIARKALEKIANWSFGWDGDCGVRSAAEDALEAMESAAPQPPAVKESEPGDDHG